MPDIEEDNFCSTFYISESQYNSIENNFAIDIFECWDFRPISHLRHLFLGAILLEIQALRKAVEKSVKSSVFQKQIKI